MPIKGLLQPTSYRIAIISFLLAITTFADNTLTAKITSDQKTVQQDIPILKPGMYVVVGAFKIASNAVQFANAVEIKGKKPSVGTYEVTGMHYVYAYSSVEELAYVREKRAELRSTKEFFDAWILYVGIDLDELLRKDNEVEPNDIVLSQPAPIAIEEPAKDDIPPPPDTNNEDTYQYQFSVINATNLREVPGYIMIVDAARNKAMRSVGTNQIHGLSAPASQSKEIIALCDIFGFVKEQVLLKIDDPMSSPDRSKISQEDELTTVTFALSRHTNIGEILTMYNVYFYSNSAIMKPESQFELNSLLSMLMENEKLEIRIHGHTNGNAAGKIISLKEEDSNYFKITNNNITGFGSAKELSKKRAEIIMRWLVSQGIEKSRMEIKAWGGKKMIYKKTNSMAGRNVRVEIEILKI